MMEKGQKVKFRNPEETTSCFQIREKCFLVGSKSGRKQLVVSGKSQKVEETTSCSEIWKKNNPTKGGYYSGEKSCTVGNTAQELPCIPLQ